MSSSTRARLFRDKAEGAKARALMKRTASGAARRELEGAEAVAKES
jgi:hypothetical protein